MANSFGSKVGWQSRGGAIPRGKISRGSKAAGSNGSAIVGGRRARRMIEGEIGRVVGLGATCGVDCREFNNGMYGKAASWMSALQRQLAIQEP